MILTPTNFLWLLVAITVVAWLVYLLKRRRHSRVLQALARDWQMHYSPCDRFNLAGRVSERFPLTGISEVSVVDLLYATEGEAYRYLFLVEYTVGVTRAKHRLQRVVRFSEPKDRNAGSEWSRLELAPEELTILEQYRNLRERQLAESGRKSPTG